MAKLKFRRAYQWDWCGLISESFVVSARRNASTGLKNLFFNTLNDMTSQSILDVSSASGGEETVHAVDGSLLLFEDTGSAGGKSPSW